MIDPERIAVFAHGRQIQATPSARLFLFIFKTDNAPSRSKFVRPEHNTNRSLVKNGTIVSWGEHGRIAIIESSDGIQAAFHFYELSEND